MSYSVSGYQTVLAAMRRLKWNNPYKILLLKMVMILLHVHVASIPLISSFIEKGFQSTLNGGIVLTFTMCMVHYSCATDLICVWYDLVLVALMSPSCGTDLVLMWSGHMWY